MSDLEPRTKRQAAQEDLAKKVQELVKKEQKDEQQESLESSSEAEVVPSTSEQAPEMTDMEKQAYALGWRPQGEYQGAHFVPADEYVRRQPLFERIDRQGRELRELRQTNEAIATHLAELRQEAYQQAMKDLEARRIQAINEGDSQQVFAAERQIKDIETRKANDPLVKQATTIQQPERNPEVDAFEARNSSWYNTNTPENRRMVEAAILADRQIAEAAAERGIVLDPKEHLKSVEEAVRANFKHRFENPKKEAPLMVGRSTTSNELSKSTSLASRLTEDQRKMGEHFVRSTMNLPKDKQYTLEKYAQELEKMGRLK